MNATIIIPTSGDTLRLRWTLEGLLLQSDTEFDIVLAVDKKDDAAEPAVGELLSCLASQFAGSTRVVSLTVGPGFRVGGARNLGVAQADGADILLFLDQDCVPDADWVAAHKAAHDACPDALVFGFRRHFPEALVVAFEEGADPAALRLSAPVEPRAQCIPCPCTPRDVYGFGFSCPSERYRQIGGMDEEFDGDYGLEDADFAMRWEKSGGVLRPLFHQGFVTHLGHAHRGSDQTDKLSLLGATWTGERPVQANGGRLFSEE
jgi:GT2 family glycosyltransferase